MPSRVLRNKQQCCQSDDSNSDISDIDDPEQISSSGQTNDYVQPLQKTIIRTFNKIKPGLMFYIGWIFYLLYNKCVQWVFLMVGISARGYVSRQNSIFRVTWKRTSLDVFVFFFAYLFSMVYLSSLPSHLCTIPFLIVSHININHHEILVTRHLKFPVQYSIRLYYAFF